ncbi:hypothetical protein OQY15_22180 [Pedobacter sp. MC2016-15]|uniref:hypothetical protein n=1 Tax=Pedobacter sp. MC2016-15 TaxID=2994473 RepID=UPI00224750C4|nr:hypothetical protein [Pedobacter sp. MC2016-15]MCX2481824.1 hypothetical protein [Pedobacter sp. MC2016-15]
MLKEETQYPYEPEFSLKQLLFDRVDDLRYVLQFKKSLILVIIVAAGLGAVFAWKWPVTYTARLTFVIDDAKSGGAGGGLSSLASQFGFNLDGIGGASGVLAGDNVQELLKSQKLIKKTLLSPYDEEGKISLADRYVKANKLDKQWQKVAPNISFPVNSKNYTRLQDSLLHDITEKILGGQFGIAKTDKKLSFFEVNTTMRDEKLAQLFCTRMIKQGTDFFIQTKTGRLRNNVQRLQHRADSIGKILNRKTYAASSASQNLLDLNPAYASVSASSDIKERDKLVLSSIFTETVKNLEASKTMLAQETPTVQIVDEPELPLKKNKLKYPATMLLFIVGFTALYSLYLIVSRKRSNN